MKAEAASGSSQICLGLEGGIKATVHASVSMQQRH